MLRVWVQQPDCTLFVRPPFRDHLSALHLHQRRNLASTLKFFHAQELRAFPKERLENLLKQHFQSSVGSQMQLAERMIAFQEFVMYAVFNGRDAKQYLQNHCRTIARE
jgi:hypothetical protein